VSRTVFVIASGLVGYTYVLFPGLVLLRARLRPRPHLSAPITPPVSVIVAARNEARAIAAKLDNLLTLDYPRDRLQVVVAADGCNDGTDATVRARGDGRVRVLSLPRVGKASALNAAVGVATGEILVFSDANSLYAPDALRALVAPFADPDVGGVAGDQRYLADRTEAEAAVATGERRYWDFDRAIKRAESRGGNAVSATGAIYAVRHELFWRVPPGVTDDFATSTAVIAQGKRLVFAPEAIAFEPVARSGRDEFARKVRVMTRGLNAVVARHELLDPRRHGFYALQLLSHKVLRRLMALPLAALALAAAVEARRSRAFRALAAVQGVLYGLGSAGLLLRRGGGCCSRVVAVPAYFCLVNVASLAALWNVVRRREIDRWEPRRSA
jgi:cellulose synthase/poly-beta-1,6-N-acetylglucosamine synthase-like glycosyltransferase